MHTEVIQTRDKEKRTFEIIRLLILHSLQNGQRTLNQLSNDTDINWKTVDNHIIYLLGRGFVTEVYFSKYVKIVEITEKGTAFLKEKNIIKPEVLK